VLEYYFALTSSALVSEAFSGSGLDKETSTE
jgi:hypothetical protein